MRAPGLAPQPAWAFWDGKSLVCGSGEALWGKALITRAGADAGGEAASHGTSVAAEI